MSFRDWGRGQGGVCKVVGWQLGDSSWGTGRMVTFPRSKHPGNRKLLWEVIVFAC